jgi:hypothetical protein
MPLVCLTGSGNGSHAGFMYSVLKVFEACSEVQSLSYYALADILVLCSWAMEACTGSF